MKLKKFLAFALALGMVLAITGCAGTNDDPVNATDATESHSDSEMATNYNVEDFTEFDPDGDEFGIWDDEPIIAD